MLLCMYAGIRVHNGLVELFHAKLLIDADSALSLFRTINRAGNPEYSKKFFS